MYMYTIDIYCIYTSYYILPNVAIIESHSVPASCLLCHKKNEKLFALLLNALSRAQLCVCVEGSL